jgi:hypothetical protein
MTDTGRPTSVLYFGSTEPLPERTALRAGPLDLVYEEGGLRYIRFGDREVIRRIYCAVRDQNWRTVEAQLREVQIDAQEDSFHITFQADHVQGPVDFTWKGDIRGSGDGTIRFGMDGLARSTFSRNRIGFCVLHPMRECAGARCVVTHEDGSTTKGSFPRFIAPEAPFLDIVSICHEVTPDLWARLDFSGDVFEMEDQRNWIDASFKTFCTPLRLPFPAKVAEGTRVEQSVRLSLEFTTAPHRATGPRPRDAAAKPSRTSIEVSVNRLGPLPKVGIQTASHGHPLTATEIRRLASMHLDHLRVDLDLGDRWESSLRLASLEARQLNAALELAVFLTDDVPSQLGDLASLLKVDRPDVARVLVYHTHEVSTSRRSIELARKRLRGEHGLQAPVGSGTNANFTELNFARPPVEMLDFVCYSLNPQSHAFDNASLVETLETHRATVQSARQFVDDLPIVISPVTLRMRLNPYATGAEPAPNPNQLPSEVDVRQVSLFGAAWTLGSLKYLAESGVASVTYYETTGWRGVMETESGCPLPERFPSMPGCVFPLYHVLADVGELAGGEVIEVQSKETLIADAMAIRRGGKTRVLVSNLTGDEQTISVRGLAGQVNVFIMDETNFHDATGSPEAFRRRPGTVRHTDGGVLQMKLLPYAVVRIDTL